MCIGKVSYLLGGGKYATFTIKIKIPGQKTFNRITQQQQLAICHPE
jgi:hypothetical protein